jgi:hypothetical protein
MGIYRFRGFSRRDIRVSCIMSGWSRDDGRKDADVSKVPFFQPETAARIFNRVMFNQDVATGTQPTTSDYSSKGPSSGWSASEVPDSMHPAKCYVWDVLETCTQEQGKILLSGKAVVEDYVLVGVRNGTLYGAA